MRPQSCPQCKKPPRKERGMFLDKPMMAVRLSCMCHAEVGDNEKQAVKKWNRWVDGLLS